MLNAYIVYQEKIVIISFASLVRVISMDVFFNYEEQ